MDLQEIIVSKNMTRYRLSQVSGVPKTTLTDLCTGKSSLANCSSRTLYQIAKALGCSMETLLEEAEPIVQSGHDEETGLPIDRSYLECGLPGYLQESLDTMKKAQAEKDSGKRDLHFDCYYCDLQADINSAEVDGRISSEQAWYLRERYLGIERG